MRRRISDRPEGFVPALGLRGPFPIYPLAGIAFLTMAAFGGPGDHRLFFGSLGLAMVSQLHISRRPALTVWSGRPVLRYRPWRNPGFRFFFLLTISGTATLSYGLTGDAPPWFVPAGLVLILGSGFITLVLLAGISRHITFEEHTLHVSDVVLSGLDWEFPWAAITGVSTKVTRGQRGGSFMEIVLTCPRGAMIDRSSPNSQARQRDPEGEWTVRAGAWTVDPAALSATIRFLADHPDQRAGVTLRQMRAMLTPPMGSERARMAQRHRLAEYRASTERDRRPRGGDSPAHY